MLGGMDFFQILAAVVAANLICAMLIIGYRSQQNRPFFWIGLGMVALAIAPTALRMRDTDQTRIAQVHQQYLQQLQAGLDSEK